MEVQLEGEDRPLKDLIDELRLKHLRRNPELFYHEGTV
jgi:hypothetical protein